ncbi:unnamed protein product [Hymenolepis diminuta]|uniref:Cullin-5 n=1 Tax=Hymenolepis diminuta TaxID=6216 RepID=A0A158QCB2_HYMDI|nr:unnamed protein product [Hymenolepis diminuta]
MLLSPNQESVFQRRWPAVNDVVHRFLNMEHVPQAEWVKLFEDVYQIISWEDSCHEKMFLCLNDSIKSAILKSQQRVMQSEDETSLLKAYNHEWTLFSEKSENLPNPFAPLDNFLGVKHKQSGPSKRKLKYSAVRKLMMDIWDVTVFEGIRQKLEDSAMKLVQDEREGSMINSSLVIGVRESCVCLSASSSTKQWSYVDHFEAAYIKSMANYYKPRTTQYINQHGIRAYLQYARTKLAEEEARARLYLDSGPNFKSVESVMETCVEVFVVSFRDEILGEFQKLLEEDAREYLKLTHELIRHVKGCEGETNPLLPILEEYIWNTGSIELNDNAEVISKDASKYVSTLMDLYNRFSSVIDECFQNEFSFLTIRDKAYQRLVNDTTIFSITMPDSTRSTTKRPESRCPTLLAAYSDMLLRKSPMSRRLSQEEILSRLKNVLLVLKYVNSKDLFLESHKAHLMRRLILETSADTEMEGTMVEKLREAGMPAELVNRLARMFTDIKVSHDLTRDFQETPALSSVTSLIITPDASPSPGPLVSLKILSCGTWLPRDLPRVSVALPPELEDYIPQIEKFYKAKHQGRQLIWQYHLCHGILAYYPPNQPADETTNVVLPIELEVTILQIAVLLAWRYRDITHKLRLDDLATATAMADSELRRTIWVNTLFT